MTGTILSGVTSAFGGLQGALIGAGVAAVLAGSAVGYAVHRWDESTITQLKLADSVADVKAVKTAAAEQLALDKDTQAQAIAEAKAQTKIVTQTQVVTKEITRYVTAKQDVSSCITFGLVRVLYGAERGVDPASLTLPAGQSDDACTGLSSSDLAALLAQDYGAARANAEQLNALIDSVKATDAIAATTK